MAQRSNRTDRDRDDDRDDDRDQRSRPRDRSRDRDRDDDRDQRDDVDVDDDQDDDDQDDDDVDYKALYEETKARADRETGLRKKHEKRSKTNWREIQKLKRTGGGSRQRSGDDDEPDFEAAVQDARESTRAEVMREFGGKLVDAEVRARAGDRLSDEQLDAILDGLDRTSFLDDDGDVDMDAVDDYVDRIAPKKQRRDRDDDREDDKDRGSRRRGTARGGSAMGQGGRQRQRQGDKSAGGVSAGRSRYQERRDARSKDSTSS